MEALTIIGEAIRTNWRRMLGRGLLFAILFQLFSLIALVVRFGALPNYITGYNWIANVLLIAQSTPSVRDMAPIIWEEWLLEIGRMNYDYGTGISEWSLNVMPSRLLMLTVLGALMTLCLTLMRRKTCPAALSGTIGATTGLGAVLVAMTNASMSWVVCCATPTWVVGLSMMGLGVSTSLALERAGPLMSLAGYALLIAMIFFSAWRCTQRRPDQTGAPLNA